MGRARKERSFSSQLKDSCSSVFLSEKAGQDWGGCAISPCFAHPCLFCRDKGLSTPTRQRWPPTQAQLCRQRLHTSYANQTGASKKASNHAPKCQDAALERVLSVDGQQICTGNSAIDQDTGRLLKSAHHLVHSAQDSGSHVVILKFISEMFTVSCSDIRSDPFT